MNLSVAVLVILFFLYAGLGIDQLIKGNIPAGTLALLYGLCSIPYYFLVK